MVPIVPLGWRNSWVCVLAVLLFDKKQKTATSMQKNEPPTSPFRSDVLKGKVALVTGGASGIGFGISTALGTPCLITGKSSLASKISTLRLTFLA